MTHGTIAGMLLTDLILGRENPWAALYDPSRQDAPRAPATSPRENLNVAAQYARLAHRRRRRRPPTRSRPGSGAVVRRGLAKVAVYRDERRGCTSARRSARTSAASSPGTRPRRPGTARATARASTRSGASSTARRTATWRQRRAGDEAAWGIGLVAVGIGASIAMAWTLSVQAQGGATTGAPPRMPPAPAKSSYTPVVAKEAFEAVLKRMKAAKAGVMKRQMDLLAERYDLREPAGAGRDDVARQGRCRTACARKLPQGMTWEQLAAHDAGGDPRRRTLFPPGFLPLPHPNHPEGGMLFPEVPHRRDQEAGGARPDPLRPRLRPARPLPARVPAADLPDHAARPGRRLARASSSRSTTSTSCSTAS